MKDHISGYHAVLLIGLGKRLGIFEYLYEKSRTSSVKKKNGSVSFTLEELAENLQLNKKYLDAWLHLSIRLGIFHYDDENEKCLKISQNMYKLFVDPESNFYLGYLYSWNYKLAAMQRDLFHNFTEGGFIERRGDEIYDEASFAGQKLGTLQKHQRINLFLKNFKNYKKILKNGGNILEIGCGYGNHLSIWATRFNNSKIVAIDTNQEVVNYVEKLIKKNKWEEQIEVKNTSLERYAQQYDKNFHIILLNEVLHELPPNEKIRRNFFENIYDLLKSDGILLVGDPMVPDLFDYQNKLRYWEIVKKWDETGFNARFYDEKSFKEFISSTSFTKAEFITKKLNLGGNIEEIYFWAIKK
jgi:2-polyprenyl-3-methyl-5-hydroxy-6-metoxy-1,4-benzoquinol methylase